MSLIPRLTVLAPLCLFATMTAQAQQPTSGGYFIHNGVVFSVPSPVHADAPGYVTTSNVVPASGSAVTNYGPAVPVTPQQPASQAPGVTPTLEGPHSVPTASNLSGLGSSAPGSGQVPGQQFASPNGQGTAIFYGSSQFRREPSPQRQQLQMQNGRDHNQRDAHARNDDRRPRLSTDPPAIDPKTQPRSGVQVDPRTGSFTRSSSAATSPTTQVDPATIDAQRKQSQAAARGLERQRFDAEQRRIAELVASQPAVNPTDPRTLRPYANLGGPRPSRLQDLPVGTPMRGMNYYMQKPFDPAASPSRSAMRYPVSQDVSAAGHRQQTFLGANPRGFSANAQGGINMNANGTAHFTVR